MGRRTYRVLVVSAVLALTIVLAGTAVAAPPDSQPYVVRTLTFEPGEPTTYTSVPATSTDVATVAFWGPVSGIKRSGTRSLWCAGTAYPSLAARTYTGTYPKATRGQARLRLPELVDYYSSYLNLYYNMPSAGGADLDRFNVVVNHVDAGGESGSLLLPVVGLTGVGSWASRSWPLATGGTVDLSRREGIVSFNFYDALETYQKPLAGVGPAIDDVSITAFKYGPARNLSASPEASGLRVSWDKPARSTWESTEETRAVTYRVWRSLADFDIWTELTQGSGRIASRNVLDDALGSGFSYDYIVQAWDPGTGAGYGQQAKLTATAPGQKPGADLVDAPSHPASVYTQQAFAVAGHVEPKHPAGITVAQIECSKDKSAIIKSVPATGADDGGATLYSASVSLPSAGVWYLRAMHDDADHAATPSTWTTITVNARPATLALTSKSVTLSRHGASYTLSGTLKSNGSAMADKVVIVQTSPTSSGFTDSTVGMETGPGGAFSVSFTPAAKTYYRVRFAADSAYAGAWSSAVSVTPVPYVSNPVAPSTMRRTRYYTVYGYLKPRHSVGSYPVRIYRYKRTSSGSYKQYRTYVKAKAANYTSGGVTYTKYSVKLRLSSRGKWRLRAYAPAGNGHGSAWSSGYDYVTVK